MVVREMIDNERYVDFNRRHLSILGCMFVSVQVGKSMMSKTRVLVAKKANKQSKSIVRRDWFTTLKYKIEHSITKGENVVNSISHENVDSEKK